MTKSTFSWELFNKAPIVGIIRGLSLEEVAQILPIYRDAGLTTIEITMNTPDAEKIIQYAVNYYWIFLYQKEDADEEFSFYYD